MQVSMAEKAELKARVAAVNRAHLHANRLYHQLAPIFQPLVGKDILKVDGSLLSKYEKLLPDLSTEEPFCYRSDSIYALEWTIKTSEQVVFHIRRNLRGKPFTVYHHTTVRIGNLIGKELKDIVNHEELRTNYTPEEIKRKIEACHTARQLFDEFDELRTNYTPEEIKLKKIEAYHIARQLLNETRAALWPFQGLL